MKKLLLIAVLGLVSANVMAADDGWYSLCVKMGAALGTMDTQLLASGVTMPTAKTVGQKVKLGFGKIGRNSAFAPVCAAIAAVMTTSKQQKGSTQSGAMADVKAVLTCPGFVCTNLFSTFASVAPKIPTIGALLAPIFRMADNMLFVFYKQSPILVNLCAAAVGEVYSKPIVIKGKTFDPLWNDLDPMACIPAASKALIDARLGVEVPVVEPGQSVADEPVSSDEAGLAF